MRAAAELWQSFATYFMPLYCLPFSCSASFLFSLPFWVSSLAFWNYLMAFDLASSFSLLTKCPCCLWTPTLVRRLPLLRFLLCLQFSPLFDLPDRNWICFTCNRILPPSQKECKSCFPRSQTLLILTKFIKKLQIFVSLNWYSIEIYYMINLKILML